MVALIFRPSRSAMSSGKGRTKDWVLVYEASDPKRVEPLMGYTSSSDMRSQVRLSFDTAEQAVAYCEREGIAYRLEDHADRTRPQISYSDNFRSDRVQPWTH